jgi:asparagine synthase (glutamine-hydrolysing)
MPGIAGLFGPRPAADCERILRAMMEALRTASDAPAGMCIAPEAGAYAGFVGGPASAGVPVAGAHDDGEVAAVFVGECFDEAGKAGDVPGNAPIAGSVTHAEARRAVRDFRAGDLAFLPARNGLFAGVIIDRRRHRAHLFSDRYGSERLYFAVEDGTTYFASEAKALLAVLPKCRSFDDASVAEYLAFGSVLRGRSLFRGIRLVPGASRWTFARDGTSSQDRYFSPAEWESLPALDEARYEEALAATLRRIVPAYARAPTRVGIALTGGLDTRMVMACLSESTRAPVCYTYAGLQGDTLDVRIARQVAARCGLEHHTLRIGDDFVGDFPRYLDSTVAVTDGTAGALAAHEIYLSKMARTLSPFRLTGNFGSEILRSMSTFKPVGLDPTVFSPGMRNSMVRAMDDERGHTAHPVTHAAFEEIPWHLHGMLAAGRSELAFRTPFLDNDVVRLAYAAPVRARRSPRAAFAVIRAGNPALAAMPTDRGIAAGTPGMFALMRRLAASVTFKLDYYVNEGLPPGLAVLDRAQPALTRAGILGLHKYLPYRAWFRGPLAPYVQSVAASRRVRTMPWLDATGVAAVVRDHLEGRRNRLREINAILTLEAVDRLLLAPAASTRATPQVTTTIQPCRS